MGRVVGKRVKESREYDIHRRCPGKIMNFYARLNTF